MSDLLLAAIEQLTGSPLPMAAAAALVVLGVVLVARGRREGAVDSAMDAETEEENNNVFTQTEIPVQARTTQTFDGKANKATKRTQTTCERSDRRTQTTWEKPAVSSKSTQAKIAPDESPAAPLAVEERAIQTDKPELSIIIKKPDDPITLNADVIDNEEEFRIFAREPQVSPLRSIDSSELERSAEQEASLETSEQRQNGTQTDELSLCDAASQTGLGFMPHAQGHSAVTQTEKGIVTSLVPITARADCCSVACEANFPAEPPIERAQREGAAYEAPVTEHPPTTEQLPVVVTHPHELPEEPEIVSAAVVEADASSNEKQTADSSSGTDITAVDMDRMVKRDVAKTSEAAAQHEATLPNAINGVETLHKSTQWDPSWFMRDAKTQYRIVGGVRNKATQWDPRFNSFFQKDFSVQVTPRTVSRGFQFSPLVRNIATMTEWPPPKPTKKKKPKKKEPGIPQEKALLAKSTTTVQSERQLLPTGEDQMPRGIPPPLPPSHHPPPSLPLPSQRVEQQKLQKPAEVWEVSEQKSTQPPPLQKYYEHVPEAAPLQAPYYGPYLESPAPELQRRVGAEERTTPFTLQHDLAPAIAEFARPRSWGK